jgi:hypothetical protein
MQPQGLRRSEPSSHFTRVPNSIIQFNGMLPPAELRLALIALCRPGSTISDQVWKEWTGLDKRIKDMAVKGLREKGLNVQGRGDKATYSFERETWETWTRSRPRHERGRTKGRSKSVTAKPGMQIHQECRERGCGRLCESQVIPFPATKDAQRVAQTETPPPKTSPPKGPYSLEDFPKTITAIRQYYPHASSSFVLKLIDSSLAKLSSCSDEQLAALIHEAKTRKPHQETEGLFLLTVPELVTAVAEGRPILPPKESPRRKRERIHQELEDWANEP